MVFSNWYYYFRCVWPVITKLPKTKCLLFICNIYLKKEVSVKVDSLHADKHESLLQIDTMILMGIIKHSQSSQNSRFAISLQYLKQEVRDEVNFLHGDKHQSFRQVDFNTLVSIILRADITIIDEHYQAFWKYSK